MVNFDQREGEGGSLCMDDSERVTGELDYACKKGGVGRVLR